MKDVANSEQTYDKHLKYKGQNFEDMNLLVIAHSYSRFTKSQIDQLAPNFDTVVVLVRYNPIAMLGEHLPIQRLQRFTKSAKITKTGIPDNIEIKTTPLWYLPTDTGYQKLGPKHYQEVTKQVSKMSTEFDLIHAHFTWTAGYAAAKLSEELDIPFVLTCHANRNRFLEEYESNNERIKETWKLADGIIRVNEKDVKILQEYNQNVYSIPNGYSKDRFQSINQGQAREEIGVPSRDNVIFSLGNLIQRKGFHELVDSIPKLSSEIDDLTCAIGGHGKERHALKSRIQRKEVEDIVELLGFVPNDKLNYWMNAADVFVLPSFSESFGVVQLEAMACGTPVVATQNGGSEEVITSDDYGILIDNPGNTDALTKALIEALHRKWDKKSIEEYAGMFTWEKVAKRIKMVYYDALFESGETR